MDQRPVNLARFRSTRLAILTRDKKCARSVKTNQDKLKNWPKQSSLVGQTLKQTWTADAYALQLKTFFSRGCRRSSVDSFAPSILPPQVRIPSTHLHFTEAKNKRSIESAQRRGIKMPLASLLLPLPTYLIAVGQCSEISSKVFLLCDVQIFKVWTASGTLFSARIRSGFTN